MLDGGSKTAIRPAKASELQMIATHLPPFPRNQQRTYFDKQERGDGCFLIAWKEGRPVGHVFVSLRPTEEDAVLDIQRKQPFIKDLFVHKNHRGQSIAYELMLSAEAEARKIDAKLIGLGVSVKNSAALNLYEKLGYEKSDHGPYFETGTFMDGDLVVKPWCEPCFFLWKAL